MEGYKTLKAGQSVSFEVIEGPKGLHATRITPIRDEERTGTPASAPIHAAAVATSVSGSD